MYLYVWSKYLFVILANKIFQIVHELYFILKLTYIFFKNYKLYYRIYRHVTNTLQGVKRELGREKFRKKSAIYLNIMVFFYQNMLFYLIIQINSWSFLMFKYSTNNCTHKKLNNISYYILIYIHK